jgi:hypothetical protein
MESRSMGWRSGCTYSTRSECISKGASIASIPSIFKKNTIGIMPHGRALTGKEGSQDTCHLDLWSKSRSWRVSMDGSPLVGKNQRYLLMLLNLTSVQDVMNQIKITSISWSANMWVLTRNEMILFSQCWRRSDKMISVLYKRCSWSASSPCSNIQKQLYWLMVSSVHETQHKLLEKAISEQE